MNLNDLSKREMQIVSLVSSGLTNPEIADRLDLSESYVKHVQTSVRARAFLANRTQLAVWYARNRLASDIAEEVEAELEKQPNSYSYVAFAQGAHFVLERLVP